MRNERERHGSDDEIDLFDLAIGVWRQRYWVLLIAVPIICFGVLYAKLASPSYEAKLHIQPPSQNDIAQLNFGRGGVDLPPLTVADVYSIYLRSLQSESVRNKFFKSVYLPSLSDQERAGSRDALYGRFNSALRVGPVSKETPLRYVVVATLEDPQQAAQWVSMYVELASDQAKREILRSARSDVSTKADNLEQQISAAIATARKQRDDQIVRLSEALVIARSIGLEKPPIISGNLSDEISAGVDGTLTYMRGTKALEAEIANLKSRESDDSFVEGLRGKQQMLQFYRNLSIDPSVVGVYQQDGGVEQPDKPVKPKRMLIVMMSLLVGVGLGVLVAMLREALVRRGRQRAGVDGR